jgi:FAD synthase
MKVDWGFDNPPVLHNAVATVGSYDGVHSGHRILLGEVISRAKACVAHSAEVDERVMPEQIGEQVFKDEPQLQERCNIIDTQHIGVLVIVQGRSDVINESFIHGF